MSGTEQTQEEQQPLPTIPDEIILDILSRLPAKSLLKFRCVSKTWNYFIRDKKFTEFHLKRTIADPSQKRVLLSVKPFWSVKYDDLDDFGKDGCDMIVKKDTPSALSCLGSNKDFDIIGECNGLICIVLRKPRKRSPRLRDPIERTYCLWNPTTNEGWEITRNDVINDMSVTCSMFSSVERVPLEVFGFGYDLTIDDYKIVKLVSYWPKNLQVEIFTVGRRSWIKKEEIDVGDRFIPLWGCEKNPNCSFVNGSFHWVVRGHMREMLILSFDLEKERATEVIPFPDFNENRFNYCKLSAIGGKLVLLTKPRAGDIEIWVMDEYGVGASWTKMVNLCEVPDAKLGTWLLPICFSRNGGILVCVNGYHYMMYDPRDETYKRSHHLPLRNRPHMSVYVESLISAFRVSNAVGEP